VISFFFFENVLIMTNAKIRNFRWKRFIVRTCPNPYNHYNYYNHSNNLYSTLAVSDVKSNATTNK
jgi:hypothetical protein